MTVRKLDHYNIRTTKYEDTVRFYVDILGMRVDRAPAAPPDFPPTWIYDESGSPAVHLTPVDSVEPEKSYAKMLNMQSRSGAGVADPPAFRGSGAVDHMAFECEGYDDVTSRLRSAEIPFVATSVSQINLRQVFIKDPNGITLELNFR